MGMHELTAETLAALRDTDTPTVCNALEIAMGGRTACGFTKQPVVCADPRLPPVVGFARTAKVRAASPAEIAPDALRELRLSYYEYVAAGPDPTLAVIEDTDWPQPVGAFWGEVNVAIHKGLGTAGAVTNGSLRDLGELDEGYQVVAGAIGPSHAFVHVTEMDCPVGIFGMSVEPGDLVHADRHGAVVIPARHFAAIAAAIDTVKRKERPILEAARKPGFDIAKLRAAWAEGEDVH